jgi:signal transduction histidine kinase
VNTDLGIIGDLSTQERRRMLEQVQHEIRTPLSSLVGHVELLEEADREPNRRLEISLHAICRAEDWLRTMLAELDEQVNVPSLG